MSSTPALESPSATPSSGATAEQFQRLISKMTRRREGFVVHVEAMEYGYVRMRLEFHEVQLRPGNSIAGPVMFTLADTALWGLVMSVAGLVPEAVTSDMNLRFLRRPKPKDLIAEARLLKRGRRLISGQVTIMSDGDPRPVAHVTGAYAAPRGSFPEPSKA